MTERLDPRGNRVVAVLDLVGLHLATTALIVLSVRAVVRLDVSYDTLWYHLPFAAQRGGIGVQFIQDARAQMYFEGFPPLAHLVQGALWRITGSVRTIGLANLLAFGLFLYFCVRLLKARFWIVALVALSSPLVLIHSTVAYVDLFGNAFLAIAMAGTFYIFYAKQQDNLVLLVWILAGLVAASWTKFQLVPTAALFYAILFCLSVFKTRFRPRRYRLVTVLVLCSIVMGAIPYLANWIEFGNPFWPFQVSVFPDLFPYAIDTTAESLTNRPLPLVESNQMTLFLSSLFEIGHPVEYENRPRWIIDQGSAWIAYRSGGFWAAGVVAALLSLAGASLLVSRRKGLLVVAGMLLVLLFTAVLPQSNELRYYLYLPLLWSALLAVVYRDLVEHRPRLLSKLLAVHIALFVYVCAFNLDHLKIEEISYVDRAQQFGFASYWETMDTEVDYCAVGYDRLGIFLTGPTLREFNIVNPAEESLCPANTHHIQRPGSR